MQEENLTPSSELYSEDLAPIAVRDRTWGKWHLVAIWVGMAVCIPTYLLASYMIKSGLGWLEALLIIGLANLIITIPMVLNGHAGVKYGIPFPVVGRAAFGTQGIHLASVTRGIVACGWFGVQTWIGGLAIYALYHAIVGTTPETALTFGKFIAFGVFWLINLYFIHNGTESIKKLESYSAPILILMGILLIVWGAMKAGGFSVVLDQSSQLGKTTATITETDEKTYQLSLNPLVTKDNEPKPDKFKLIRPSGSDSPWFDMVKGDVVVYDPDVKVQFKNSTLTPEKTTEVITPVDRSKEVSSSKIWQYLLWLTAMVGFWATMAISISDITRYAKTQKDQVFGQFIGLPGTMMLYSFVGIFVTCAAVINFDGILIAEEAPWDPVTLLSNFENRWVVIVSQLFMLIATLSTNIAANVIAPSNAFSNLWPQKISFRTGGYITAIIGILIAPWWLLDEISGILVFVSGLLGPVLGILVADYFMVRKTNLQLNELYKPDGEYSFGGSGFNRAAMVAFAVGVGLALVGYWVPSLGFLYSLSWFTGFFISFFLYIVLMKKRTVNVNI